MSSEDAIPKANVLVPSRTRMRDLDDVIEAKAVARLRNGMNPLTEPNKFRARVNLQTSLESPGSLMPKVSAILLAHLSNTMSLHHDPRTLRPSLNIDYDYHGGEYFADCQDPSHMTSYVSSLVLQNHGTRVEGFADSFASDDAGRRELRICRMQNVTISELVV